MINPGLILRFGAVLAGGGILAFGVGFATQKINGVYLNGRAHERAIWQEKLAIQESEAEAAIDAARRAGIAQAAIAASNAQNRNRAVDAAINEVRDELPGFDEVLRHEWPDDYFISVCDGRGAGCQPQIEVD